MKGQTSFDSFGNGTMLLSREEGENEDTDSGLEERLSENTRIIRYNELDYEVTEIANLINSIIFNNKPTTKSAAFIRSTPITTPTPLENEDFEMIIGSSDTPRFSYACHKLNIVIQTAVEKHIIVKDILKKLNSFTVTSRNIIDFFNVSSIFNFRSIEIDEKLNTEYSINEILNISVNGFFAKKVFLIKNEVKNYSNRLHWFSSSPFFIDIDPFQEIILFCILVVLVFFLFI